jgi:hypothetical protein
MRYKYSLNGTILSSKDVVRDLGIYVSHDIKWRAHVDYITKKALSRLYLLFKSIRSNDPKFLTRMYNVYVLPLIDYGSSIYNSTSKQNLALIEKVQKRFTRLLFVRCFKYVYRDIPSYSERLQILCIDSLEVHLLRSDLILFHKFVTNNIFFQTNCPIFCDFYSTRTNPRGIIPTRSTKNARNDFFTIRLARLYLKLPSDITSLSFPLFQSKVKRLDLSFLLN